MLGEIIAELLHLLVVYAVQRNVGNGVEANQINPAIQPLQQLYDFLCVAFRIVHTLENDILERQTALVREVVIAQQLYDVGNRHTTLAWHNLCPLGRNGRVHAYCNVAVALFKKPFQLGLHTD